MIDKESLNAKFLLIKEFWNLKHSTRTKSTASSKLVPLIFDCSGCLKTSEILLFTFCNTVEKQKNQLLTTSHTILYGKALGKSLNPWLTLVLMKNEKSQGAKTFPRILLTLQQPQAFYISHSSSATMGSLCRFACIQCYGGGY